MLHHHQIPSLLERPAQLLHVVAGAVSKAARCYLSKMRSCIHSCHQAAVVVVCSAGAAAHLPLLTTGASMLPAVLIPLQAQAAAAAASYAVSGPLACLAAAGVALEAACAAWTCACSCDLLAEQMQKLPLQPVTKAP